MNYEEFLQLKIEEQNKKNIEDFIMYLNSSAGKTKVKNFLQRIQTYQFKILFKMQQMAILMQ